MTGPNAELRGEVFTNALPAEDPVLYGNATLSPQGSFEARSLHTFDLTYTCGRYGLDDTGSVRIVFRFTADGGPLQWNDPKGLNYVSATSSNGADCNNLICAAVNEIFVVTESMLFISGNA